MVIVTTHCCGAERTGLLCDKLNGSVREARMGGPHEDWQLLGSMHYQSSGGQVLSSCRALVYHSGGESTYLLLLLYK